MKKSISGSSMIEFIVALLVFVPLFIAIPLLGKYADIKHKTIESSRYVAWERTIYSDEANGSWKDYWVDENDNQHAELSMTDEEIFAQAEIRFFGHPQQGLHQSEITENPLWRNNKGESLLALSEQEDDPYLSGEITESSPIAGSNFGTQIAGGAVQLVATGSQFRGLFGSGSEGANDIVDRTRSDSGVIGRLMGGGSLFGNVQCGVPGINLNEGIGLGKNNFVEVEVNTPVINFLKMDEDGDDLSFTARSALLSNAWTAPSDEAYYERLDNMVPNQFLGCITLPGRYSFGLLGRRGRVLFGEGQYSHQVHMAQPSTILPNGLTYYDENRE